MRLFRKTEPAAEPESQSALSTAIAEELAASHACTESIERCKRLDAEQRFWLQRRETAMRDHNAALARHAKAKEQRERLAANLTPAGGSVRSVVAAAGALDGGKY